jgi:hypothetical protein
MSNERTPVRPNLDVPANSGPVLRNFEGAVTAENPAGGEVRRELYSSVGPVAMDGSPIE